MSRPTAEQIINDALEDEASYSTIDHHARSIVWRLEAAGYRIIPADEMTADQILTDLRERLTKAYHSLIDARAGVPSATKRFSLMSKASGVALALDCLKAYSAPTDAVISDEQGTARTEGPEPAETSVSDRVRRSLDEHLDAALWGNVYLLAKSDGTSERIDPADVQILRKLPPPKRGTHESDTGHVCPCDVGMRAPIEGQSIRQHNSESDIACNWSRGES